MFASCFGEIIHIRNMIFPYTSTSSSLVVFRFRCDSGVFYYSCNVLRKECVHGQTQPEGRTIKCSFVPCLEKGRLSLHLRMLVKAVFIWALNGNCVCLGFALLCLMIEQQDSLHFLNQLRGKPNQLRLALARFPALGAGLLLIVIGSLHCFGRCDWPE